MTPADVRTEDLPQTGAGRLADAAVSETGAPATARASPSSPSRGDARSHARSRTCVSPMLAPAAPPERAESAVFSRLRRGLGRTSDNLVQGMGTLFLGRKEIDAELLEELESRLLLADVGVDATVEIIERLTQRVSRKELTSPEALQAALQEELLALLQPCEQPLDVSGHKPFVILMVGVNGVGKTTTIGKLAQALYGRGPLGDAGRRRYLSRRGG